MTNLFASLGFFLQLTPLRFQPEAKWHLINKFPTCSFVCSCRKKRKGARGREGKVWMSLLRFLKIELNHFLWFWRLLPSTRVSHSISVRDVVDVKIAAMQPCHSSPTFMCGVAKPQRRIRTCPSQEKKHSERFLERFHSEPSISHHKYSLNANCNSRLSERPTSHAPLSSNTCKSRVSHLTLKDVVDTKRACFCRGEKFIGIRDHQERQVGLEPSEVSFNHSRCCNI